MNGEKPGQLTLADLVPLTDKLVRRADKLAKLVADPKVPLELVQKQRVLVFNTAADLLSVKHRAEDGQ
jgi:hypothetical protein